MNLDIFGLDNLNGKGVLNIYLNKYKHPGNDKKQQDESKTADGGKTNSKNQEQNKMKTKDEDKNTK